MTRGQKLELPPLTDDESKMVAANLGLVQWTMNRWFSHLKPHEHEDAWQDGVLGLMRAVQKFDPATARIATYAPIWIRQSIDRGREQFEGVNYRALKRTGHVADYRCPVSLSADVMRDNGFGALVVEDQVEDRSVQVEDAACWREVFARLADLCADDVDRAILRCGLDMADEPAYIRDRVVAAELGLASETVRRRRQKLHARAVLVTEEMAA